jgi:hypothetical protein
MGKLKKKLQELLKGKEMSMHPKFVITPETLEKNKLSPKRKFQLQNQIILDLVKQVDGKHPITLKEFQKRLLMSHAQTDRIVTRVRESGAIVGTRPGTGAYTYTINPDYKPVPVVKLEAPKAPVVTEPKKTPKVEKPETIIEPPVFQTLPGLQPYKVESIIPQSDALLAAIQELNKLGVEFKITINSKEVK